MSLPLNYRKTKWVGFEKSFGERIALYSQSFEVKKKRLEEIQRHSKKVNTKALENEQKPVVLTFNAFLAASAPERLSKVTNPTGWKTETTCYRAEQTTQ